MVKLIRRSVERDGFLGALHLLLLMDDTVILATTRESCMLKLRALVDYCDDYGMRVNLKKTKFMVINGDENDRLDFTYKHITVKHQPTYLYLGAWITESGKIKDAIKLHVEHNSNLVNKFAIFCSANSSMPFKFKRKVFDAAITSALLYSTESWTTNSIKSLEKQYHSMIKCLLNVRPNTSIKLCMVEAGIPPLSALMKRNRQRFLARQFAAPNAEHPFHQMHALCAASNTPAARFLRAAAEQRPDPSGENLVRAVIENAHGTKFNTYKTVLNPQMNVSPVYTTNDYIPDYQRTAYTRIRVMSHRLKVETGRWSRIPADQRVCPCDGTSVQDEEHVLITCPNTLHLRQRFPRLTFTSAAELLDEPEHLKDLCAYAYNILSHFS